MICWKQGFPHPRDARAAIRRIGKPRLRMYLCPDCGDWHLTSAKKFRGQVNR